MYVLPDQCLFCLEALSLRIITNVRLLVHKPVVYPGLEINKYDKSKCQDAFIAYKECKQQEVRLCTLSDLPSKPT